MSLLVHVYDWLHIAATLMLAQMDSQMQTERESTYF